MPSSSRGCPGTPVLDGARLEVRRTGPLSGRVVVPGAKNSVLKLMAAGLLTDGTCRVTNVPDIVDVSIMADLLTAIGLRVDRPSPNEVVITNSGDITPVAPADLTDRIRASVNVLGPLLSRYGRVVLPLPGGDDFGARPIDMHIAGLEAMGAEFSIGGDALEARAPRLHGADVSFAFPSVGATENVVMAAVLADGTTTIDGAAREPEIVDLCEFLIGLGARIDGVGTSHLVIHGVERDALGSVTHRVVPDRIQAATYIAAVAVAGGRLEMVDARARDMERVLDRVGAMGLGWTPFHDEDGSSGLVVEGTDHLRSVDVQTLPYPGIATDYKPLMTTMLAVADGVAIVTENLYPGRFRYIDELRRLGADIRTEGHHAVVHGVRRLAGTRVTAHDIRAGAAMVVAGLAAEGTTVIDGVHHIDRGYDDLVGRLTAVGADIVRVD
ncbi:MAG: UDP-N-acetylglucosamine 1-carboxyvinyltransferase [Actinomycetota bacterium]